MADPRLCASMAYPHAREKKICRATLSSSTHPFNSFSADPLIAMPNAHPSVPDLTFSVPPATSVRSSADADLLNPALGLNAAPVVDAERHATVTPLDADPLVFQCLSSVGMTPVQEPATEAIVDCTTRLADDSTLHDAPFLNIDMDPRETIPYDTDLTQTVFGNKNPASDGKKNSPSPLDATSVPSSSSAPGAAPLTANTSPAVQVSNFQRAGATDLEGHTRSSAGAIPTFLEAPLPSAAFEVGPRKFSTGREVLDDQPSPFFPAHMANDGHSLTSQSDLDCAPNKTCAGMQVWMPIKKRLKEGMQVQW